MKINKYKRGQIWWYTDDKEYEGNLLGKNRPYIIVSCDTINNSFSNVIAVPLTTNDRFCDEEWRVELPTYGNTSWAVCEQVRSISAEKLTSYVGQADDEIMKKIDTALGIVLDLESEG